MTTFMHAFQPHVPALMRFASRERLLAPGDDLGYALHVLLTASFGEFAPKPFVWCAPGTRSGGQQGRVLCYSSTALSDLADHARSFADPWATAALQIGNADTKAMPDEFVVGAHLGFRIRVRPVVRTGKARDGSGGKERDAYIGSELTNSDSGTRGRCYYEWLKRQLTIGGAELQHARLEAFSLTRLMTRDRSGERSRRNAPTGPDATLVGALRVYDPVAFAAMLRRGVGRFRAFGFGMLLLMPPVRTAD